MTVLIVGQDAATRELCRTSLGDGGYHVQEALDWEDALGRISRVPPDVIVTDGAASTVEGLPWEQRLKANPSTRDVPWIMIDAQGAEHAKDDTACADDYLNKPLSTRDVLLRVRSMARLGQTRLELRRSRDLRAEQARLWMVLLDLARSLAKASDLKTALQRVADSAAELACSSRVSLMLPDNERRYLTIAKAIGIDEQVARRFQVPVGSPIVGQVFASQQRAVINTSEEVLDHCHGYEADFFVSIPMVAVALSTAEKPVGVLNITHRLESQPFESWELEFIDLLASMGGSAIQDILTRQARDEARDSIVVALATLAEYRDNDTGRHVERVTQLCLTLARQLQAIGADGGQIDQTFLHHLKRAVPLHDIGKVAIPDAILLKPGPLTPNERSVMQTHSSIGRDAIRAVNKRTPGVAFLQMAEQIAWCHHERHDGTGYPRGLAGDEIPLSARIVAVADVYDAITSRRVYSDAMPHEKAVSIIREGAGTQFDPTVTEAFLKCERDFARLAVELPDNVRPAGGGARDRHAA